MKRSVIVVAGGKGLRMGGDLPKQFIEIAGKPVLMHTLETFRRFDETMQLVVVLPANQQTYWQSLCERYAFDCRHEIVTGGETRFHSVFNGLRVVTGDWVAVHDGVRPFVSQAVIARCFDTVLDAQAVVPVVDIVETIRQINGQGSKTVPRNAYKLVQTPQVFNTLLLRSAYAQPYVASFTDDASVVEAWGQTITLVEGNRENIKLTAPADLAWAQFYLQQA